MNEEEERHRAAMKQRKAEQDRLIAGKRDADGLLLIYTGNGKGKSTAAFGLVARACGTGLKVGIVQYIKGKWMTGERRFFTRFPDEVRFHVMGQGFTWETQDAAIDRAAADSAWRVSAEMIADPALNLVVLDELNVSLSLGQLPLDPVLEALKTRPPAKHVCITGRNAPAALLDMADLVTEMTEVKHPFQAGIKAARGIDY